MKYKILYPSHETISGIVEFTFVELDPYNNYHPTNNKQVFRERIAEYHYDVLPQYGVKFDEPHAAEKFILEQLKEKFDFMIEELNEHIAKDVMVIQGETGCKQIPMPQHFSIE